MESLVNNLDLFIVLRDQLGTMSDSVKLCDYLRNKLGFELANANCDALRKFCQKFCSNVKGRWEKCNRSLSQFIRRNGDWLETPINWPQEISTYMESANPEHVDNPADENIENLPPSTSQASTSSICTPKKPFEELCSKQKRRRVDQISKSLLPEELQKATVKSLKNSGNEEISKVMKHLLEHPEDVEKVQHCLHKKSEDAYSPEKALALAVSLKLSKWQYINLKESASEQGMLIYPSYYKLKQEKTKCYPAKADMVISEDGASIKLQALLDLTASRLLEALDYDTSSRANLQLVSKWGFDGASGQSNYKQKTTTDFDDSSIFMASLVPIRLLHEEEVVWENDRPSSTHYCRPIMFKFIKETKQTADAIKEQVMGEIGVLQFSKINEVEVKHQLHLTMIDGKICSYISETSSAVCDICEAKPSEMKNLDAIDNKQKNEEMFKYGLSSLHAWIRCMECILHIAYRLEFKQWRSSGENKDKMKKRKLEVQQAFKNESGLLIDVVKQGAGTTNDGNTARRFFANASMAARITGVSEDLIERFYVVLQTIASGELIDLSKFSVFCRDTAILFIQLYPWYNMPHSVHKLLIHGADIIGHFGLLPIGKLSEEAAEARNKDFRKYRENFSRKVSRSATNEDIIHHLLLSSDPKFTALRPSMAKQKRMVLSSKATELLVHKAANPNEISFVNVNELEDNSSDSD